MEHQSNNDINLALLLLAQTKNVELGTDLLLKVNKKLKFTFSALNNPYIPENEKLILPTKKEFYDFMFSPENISMIILGTPSIPIGLYMPPIYNIAEIFIASTEPETSQAAIAIVKNKLQGLSIDRILITPTTLWQKRQISDTLSQVNQLRLIRLYFYLRENNEDFQGYQICNHLNNLKDEDLENLLGTPWKYQPFSYLAGQEYANMLFRMIYENSKLKEWFSMSSDVHVKDLLLDNGLKNSSLATHIGTKYINSVRRIDATTFPVIEFVDQGVGSDTREQMTKKMTILLSNLNNSIKDKQNNPALLSLGSRTINTTNNTPVQKDLNLTSETFDFLSKINSRRNIKNTDVLTINDLIVNYFNPIVADVGGPDKAYSTKTFITLKNKPCVIIFQFEESIFDTVKVKLEYNITVNEQKYELQSFIEYEDNKYKQIVKVSDGWHQISSTSTMILDEVTLLKKPKILNFAVYNLLGME